MVSPARSLRRRVTLPIAVATSLTLVLVGTVACSAPAPARAPIADQHIDVDLTDALGPVTHGASGALYGLGNPGTPPAADLAPLHLQTIVQMAPDGAQHPDGDALKVGPQFFAAGGKRVLVYAQDFYPDWPYKTVSMADYGDLIAEQMAKVAAAPDADRYAWVPFNEPDWIWYGTTGAKLDAFLQDWTTIYRRIRTIDPDAVIVGPAFEHYDGTALRSFLAFAKANRVLPDVISWHELDDDFATAWNDHYEDYRAAEDQAGVGRLPIDINEYGQPAEMGVPGRMLQYLARFDASRVSASMASWWAGEWLGRTLNKRLQRTSGWYLYRWYGQATGTSLRVTPQYALGPLQGVASIAADRRSARVIVGGSDGTADVRVTGVGATALGTAVRVRVWSLRDSGTRASTGPVLVSDSTATVSKGRITVTVPGLTADGAALVQLD